jgi:misacylated tRNA(Ala) deacylase
MSKEYPPQMHTAEHILNQTMVRMFKCGRSFSNHIEKKKSKCDYHFNRDLSEAEINEIQSRVNRVIEQNFDVNEEFLPRDKAAELFDLERLPDAVGEIIRIIKVGDYDSCPCIGQHIPNTSEIGEFKIISTGYENGVLRIRFKIEEKV